MVFSAGSNTVQATGFGHYKKNNFLKLITSILKNGFINRKLLIEFIAGFQNRYNLYNPFLPKYLLFPLWIKANRC